MHIDIFTTEKKLVLTTIDKLSKYAMVRVIPLRAVEHIRGPLTVLMISFGIQKLVVIDNEKLLNSASISFLLKDQLGIDVFTISPYSRAVNGQTIPSKIMRCLKPDNTHVTVDDLLYKALKKHNSSIHKTIRKLPIETFFGNRIFSGPGKLDRFR